MDILNWILVLISLAGKALSNVKMFVCFYIIRFETFKKIQYGERKVEVVYINWRLERKVACKMQLLLQRMFTAEMRNSKLISF